MEFLIILRIVVMGAHQTPVRAPKARVLILVFFWLQCKVDYRFLLLGYGFFTTLPLVTTLSFDNLLNLW